MAKNKDKLLLLYLFQNSNLKEIDIYSLSKTMLRLRNVMEAYTIGGQNKNENDNIVELELRGYLSATDGNYRPLGTFTVIVYTKGDKLYGSII